MNEDLDDYGKMDPFCKVVFNHTAKDPADIQKYKTKVKHGAGKTPKWN
jgi:hypothetical protein